MRGDIGRKYRGVSISPTRIIELRAFYFERLGPRGSEKARRRSADNEILLAAREERQIGEGK